MFKKLYVIGVIIFMIFNFMFLVKIANIGYPELSIILVIGWIIQFMLPMSIIYIYSDDFDDFDDFDEEMNK